MHGPLDQMVLLNPDTTQGLDRRNLPEPHRGGGQESEEQGIAVATDGQRQGVARCLPGGQPINLGTARVPRNPLRVRMSLEPAWRDHGEAVERMAHRLANHLDPVECPHSSEDMGAIGALPSPRFHKLPLSAPRQQGVKQQLLSPTIEQPGAKLAEYRGVEAGIGQFGVEDVFLVDPAPECIRRAAVGEFFGKLENRYEG